MTGPTRLGVVIVAAGSGVRFGDSDKALTLLGGRPLLDWSLRLFAELPVTCEMVVVAAEHTRDRCCELLPAAEGIQATVVNGGVTRTDSMRAGLAALGNTITHVAIHDAARPLLTRALVERVLAAAVETGAAVPVVPVSDTLHMIGPDGQLASTLDRTALRAAQTPQIARKDWLDAASQAPIGSTDEGGLLHGAGYPVTLVEGDPANLKITWPEDLTLAEGLLRVREVDR